MNIHNCTEGATFSMWYKTSTIQDGDDFDGAVLFSFRMSDSSKEVYLYAEGSNSYVR